MGRMIVCGQKPHYSSGFVRTNALSLDTRFWLESGRPFCSPREDLKAPTLQSAPDHATRNEVSVRQSTFGFPRSPIV